MKYPQTSGICMLH